MQRSCPLPQVGSGACAAATHLGHPTVRYVCMCVYTVGKARAWACVPCLTHAPTPAAPATYLVSVSRLALLCASSTSFIIQRHSHLAFSRSIPQVMGGVCSCFNNHPTPRNMATSTPKVVGYFTDVEGNWEYFQRCLGFSSVLEVIVSDSRCSNSALTRVHSGTIPRNPSSFSRTAAFLCLAATPATSAMEPFAS